MRRAICCCVWSKSGGTLRSQYGTTGSSLCADFCSSCHWSSGEWAVYVFSGARALLNLVMSRAGVQELGKDCICPYLVMPRAGVQMLFENCMVAPVDRTSVEIFASRGDKCCGVRCDRSFFKYCGMYCAKSLPSCCRPTGSRLSSIVCNEQGRRRAEFLLNPATVAEWWVDI